MTYFWRRVCVPALLALTVAAVLSMVGAAPNDKVFVVIVNKANPLSTLKRAKVSAAFLRQISRWPFGAEITAVDLPDKSPVREAFLKGVLRMTAEDLRAYWIDQKLTHNIDPPIRVATPAEALRLVASKPGGIAFIPAELADYSVKVLILE
jgi:hypothetical protein